MNTKIRRATPEDAEIVVEQLKRICSLHHSGRPDIFKNSAAKYSVSDFTEMLNDPKTIIFIAECDEKVIGYEICNLREIENSSTKVGRRYFYIDDLYIDDIYRRNKIGEKLFNEARAFAASHGIKKIELNVWAFNVGAIHFYENLGMTPQRMEMETDVPEIKELTHEELPTALNVIHRAFATVADDFGLTRENCPSHTSFMSIEALTERFNAQDIMTALYLTNEMIGCFTLTKCKDGVYDLSKLSVLPEYRHMGYGSLLLREATEKVRKLGGREIVLSIIEESTVLKSWYEANGFVHIGAQKIAQFPFTVGYMKRRI